MGYGTMWTRYDQFNSNRSDVIEHGLSMVWPLLHYPQIFFIHASMKTCPDYVVYPVV